MNKTIIAICLLIFLTGHSQTTGNPNTGDAYLLFGPNTSWGQYLKVGGNGRGTTNASVVATNGNLHLDSRDGSSYKTYINHYSLGHTILNAQGGNVGIGTTAPVDKLHIMDGNLRLSNGNDRMYLRVDNTNSKSQIAFGDDLNDRLDFFFDYWNGTSSDKEVMSLLANGRVGIGTTTPDAKLTVKGDIHAEEVKVDLSVPGPDYVFKEGYDLKSLEEVQNFIKENGHLPNIPSALEMEENGIQLGEMNMKLLEKIEELTLYAFEQEAMYKEKDKEITNLKNRLTKIEQLLNKN
nr:tail fiber protein [uncultured Allomuricauda sp.]